VKRRIFQIAFLVLLNLPLLGEWKFICLPVLNCHSCPWAVTSCPIGVLGHFAAWGVLPLMALGTIGMFGAVFGRFLCGWVCPFGFLQDMLYKIPSPKFVLRRWTRAIKYILLVASVFLAAAFIGLDSYTFFCRLCPAGTSESLIPRALMDGNAGVLFAAWPRIFFMMALLAMMVFSLRSFCKVFCPIGAILGIFNRVSMFGLRYKENECPSCEVCLQECPMDVEINDFRKGKMQEHTTAPAECILCLNCTHNCHQSGLRFSLWNLWPLGRKKTSDSPETSS
jgi:polyferredoxin